MLARSFAVVVGSVLVLGCPSGGGGPDAQTSSGAPAGSGPLANLEASPFLNEVWMTDDNQQVQVLYYARENVRVSAPCRSGSGQLTCAAMQYLRNGQPVQIPRRSLDGRTSAGVKVCQRLSQPIVRGHNTVGAEDSFCRFPDGSLLSNGALEQYGMRVIE
jgi:hypothetical protein